MGKCSEYIAIMSQQALRICTDPDQEEQVLTTYVEVFSRDGTYFIRTKLVEHRIPVDQGTVPIRQPPRTLGPEKD